MAIFAAMCVVGCSWIVGVNGDPEVIDVADAFEVGNDRQMQPDTAPKPTNDAANADEDAGVDEDADGAVDQ